MAIHDVYNNLFLVDLDLPMPGFSQFIGSWILRDGDGAIVIDPGPATTIDTLRGAIDKLGIKRVDFILLTHIHLDHAGGCGRLIETYPDAVIFCHPRAVSHLADPEKLWQGSLKVLGDLAEAYGKPSPISEDKISTDTDIVWRASAIQSLETPGHAYHHLCFFLDDIVFAGEVAGVNLPLEGNSYLRPATPPPFRPNIALNSISLVAERTPTRICFGHYGLREDAVDLLHASHEQIQLWLNLIQERRNKNLSLDEDEVFREVLDKDPRLSSFNQLEPDTKARELYFCKNAIRGMVDFLNSS
jgi:glyoxylase-like metal-dependent hydrolase (beta-lactamase superfamily II)